eukprot:TRINITY_DN2788_c0_g1_i2.p1 TRINITY_DN2788_c0_g1~~TRINITY_DN2788_c0_g1_i2.p1  ORF type:complete len:483 (-),score=188.91 TRINITY_DN2788_c0_g1_i2:166-1614(-)
MSTKQSSWDWAAPKRLDASEGSTSPQLKSPAGEYAEYKPYVERRGSREADPDTPAPAEPGFAIPSSLLLSAAQQGVRRQQAVAQLGMPSKAAPVGSTKFDRFDGNYRSDSPESDPWTCFDDQGSSGGLPILSDMEKEQRVEVMDFMHSEISRQEQEICCGREALNGVQVDLAEKGLGLSLERRQRLSWDLQLKEKEKTLQQQREAVALLQEQNRMTRDDVLAQAEAVEQLQQLHGHRTAQLAAHEAALAGLGEELARKNAEAQVEWGHMESLSQSLSSPEYNECQSQDQVAQLEAHVKLTDQLAHKLSEHTAPSAAEMQAHSAAIEALSDVLQRSKHHGSREAEMQAHVRMSEALAIEMVQIDQQRQALTLMRDSVEEQRGLHLQEAQSLEKACATLAEMQGGHALCQAALADAQQALEAHQAEVEVQRAGVCEAGVRVHEKQQGLEQQLWGAAKQEEELQQRAVQLAQQRDAFSAINAKLP